MIIEGNLLIGILIVMALLIAALVVFIRFAVKKEPSEAGSLFARLLMTGDKDEQENEQDAASETATTDAGGPGGLSLSMPGSAIGKALRHEVENKSPFSMGIGDLFSGGLGSRKSKDQIKDEVKAIDEQLNNVLHESEEINVLGMPPQISPNDSPFSDGIGMRELDMEMGMLQGPLEIISPEELKPEPPAFDLASPVSSPLAAPPGLEGEPVKVEQKKPDTPRTPVESEAAKPQVDFMADTKKNAGDDLLSDLEASTKQEEMIDLSIMKEYQDMPITCVELESDLKGILDQITINGQGKR
jgi:hypothetical protein